MKINDKKEFFITILTLVYLVPFFVLISANMLFSLFQTTYMELYQDTEKPLYTADSPLLLILFTALFLFLCILFFRKKEVTPKLTGLLEKISLVWSILLSLFIIFLFRVRVSCDSKYLSDIAIAFLNGDYSALTGDGYLVHYPHQLGMIGLLQLIYSVFGIDNFTLLQLLNVIAIFSTVYYIHRITDELFCNPQIQALLSLLCMGMLPLYLYSTFIYGDIPGLGLAVPALYYTIRYLNTKKKRYVLPAVLCMTLAITLKSNNTVLLVAIVLILLLHVLQTKDFFALFFAAALFLGTSLTSSGINAYYANASGIGQIPDGIPKVAWIAMGLQENEYIENGWYNSYNWDIYTENNYDTAATTEACTASVKESVSSFVSAPKSCLHFFYKKFISQWNDPGYQSQITIEWYSRHRDDHSDLALYLIYGNGRFLIEALMNLYHFMILLGSSIFAFYGIREKNLTNTLLSLCVFGGYFFHLIWEAGGRYGLGYFVLCVPMAAWGFWKLSTVLSNIISSRKK